MLFEEDAVYRSYHRANARSESKGRSSEERARAELAVSLPSTVDAMFEEMMRYESALDRGFHRDTFLLLQLQQLAGAGTSLPSNKHAQNGSKPLEGTHREISDGSRES